MSSSSTEGDRDAQSDVEGGKGPGGAAGISYATRALGIADKAHPLVVTPSAIWLGSFRTPHVAIQDNACKPPRYHAPCHLAEPVCTRWQAMFRCSIPSLSHALVSTHPSCGAPVHGAYQPGCGRQHPPPTRAHPAVVFSKGQKVITGVCTRACYTVGATDTIHTDILRTAICNISVVLTLSRCFFIRVFAKVRFSKCTSLKIVPKAAFAVHF